MNNLMVLKKIITHIEDPDEMTFSSGYTLFPFCFLCAFNKGFGNLGKCVESAKSPGQGKAR